MGLLDILSPALNVATQAAGAYEGARAGAEKQQKADLVQNAALERQAQQQRIAEALAARQAKSAEITDALHQQQTTHLAAEPVKFSPQYFQGLTKEEDIKREHGYHAAPSEPSWQVLQTDDGAFQVNPKTGESRPIILPGGVQAKKPMDATTKKRKAGNAKAMSTIDKAIADLESHPDAVGLKRGWFDLLDQRIDPSGVETRAGVADVGTQQIHDRTGATMTVKESQRLSPMVPGATDSQQAALVKLRRLRQAIDAESGGGESKPSFAQRVQELKAQGMSKADARAALANEGYDPDTGQ